MCGIFGTINWQQEGPIDSLVSSDYWAIRPYDDVKSPYTGPTCKESSCQRLSLLRHYLRHRGPDEQHDIQLGRVYLFQSRLAIQDLSAAGRQPMTVGHLTIVYNGEIYNHQELRRQHGLSCRSTSDTETLLHLYERLGSTMFDQLDGMFAMAIYDARTQQLLLARDRVGKKPLYLYRVGDRLAFSSELNALAAFTSLTVADEAIASYLRIGFFGGNQTPYREVTKLPAGHYAEIDCQTMQVTIRAWWLITSFYRNPQFRSEADALDQLDMHLTESIRRRLTSSDREVGVFLSGGIDSSLVTALAARMQTGIVTFTVASSDSLVNEAPWARLVADQYATDHMEVQLPWAGDGTMISESAPQLADEIETILIGYGEPFMDSSAIPTYYVARTAGKRLSVVLTGDGADELFGGYRRYVPYARLDFNQINPVIQRGLNILHSLLPLPSRKTSLYTFAYRLIDMARKSAVDRYLSATTDIFENYNDRFVNPMPTDYLTALWQELDCYRLSSLQKAQLMDFQTILPNDLLVKMDIATMAHSVESRSPFLARELLNWVPGLPDSWKINGLTTKYLLRKLAQRYLPISLVMRPKRGFEVPLRYWLEHGLKPIVYDYLMYPKLVHQFVQPDFIQFLLGCPRNRRANGLADEKRAKMLYALFAAEVWYRNRVRHG